MKGKILIGLVTFALIGEISLSKGEEISLSKLQVKGNKIVNGRGEKILLRGINIADPKVLRDEGHFTEKDFALIVKDWGAKIIRVPIHPQYWSSSYIDDYLVPLSKWAEKYQVYLLFDYHDFGDPSNRIELIKERWSTIAERFSDRPWVLYDIFNEPHSLSWGRWKVLAERIIDAIRAMHKDSLIFVGGTDWGYNLEDVLANPINRKNIVYSTHPYPNRSKPLWDTHFGYLSGMYPVFAGEWGFTEEKIGPDPLVYYAGPESSYGKELLNYFEKRGIHWTAWVMHPNWYPNLIKDWNYTPTPFGKLVKATLRKEVR